MIRIAEGHLGKEFPSLETNDVFKVRGETMVLEHLH